MKNIVLAIICLMLIPYTLKAQNKCSELKCNSGETKVEIPDGFECRKTGTNIKHGSFCRDKGFYQNDESLGRVIYRGAYKEGDRHGNFTEQVGAVPVEELGYQDGRPHGKKFQRDPKSGQVLEEGTYAKGKGNGVFTYLIKEGLS